MISLLYKIVKMKWLQHLVFWMLSLYIIGAYFSISNTFKSIDLVYSVFFHFSLLALVYLNIRVLIPQLLETKKYALYGVAILTLLALTYGVHELTFEIAIPLLPIDYYIVSFVDPIVLITVFSIYLILSTLIKLSESWFKVQQLQQDKLAMELESLKFQVNPHFLLNSLNNVYGLALKKSDDTPEVILKLSNILKHMLYESTSDQINLSSELSYLEDYVELQKLRVSDNVRITLNISGSYDGLQIAPFLLINLIENSFKHGLRGSLDNPFALFEISIEANNLFFSSRNSLGQNELIETEGGGLGLKNVRRRLELLYPKKHSFTVVKKDKEFITKLSLDLL